MKNLSVVLLFVGLSGCVSAPETMALPDGRTAQMAYCDGVRDSIAACMNEAATKCGGAYEVVDRVESDTVRGSNGSVSSMPRREIAYVCRTN